jgi:hypothetical protein
MPPLALQRGTCVDEAGVNRAMTRQFGRGARRRDCPPYSPALAPLAHAWSKIKPFWRTAKARTRAALEWTLQHAWPTLTAADAHGWFTSCG